VLNREKLQGMYRPHALHLNALKELLRRVTRQKNQIPNKSVKQNKNEMQLLFKVCVRNVFWPCVLKLF